MEQRYDVYGIGNAIVDTEVQVESVMLTAHGLQPGMMTLVSIEDQELLLEGLAGYAQQPAAGGSAANTMVGVAQFGGRALFTGKVGNDMTGALYRQSMLEAGVEMDVDAADGPTGTCLVLVTPDGERTMQTSLGSSSTLEPNDIRGDGVARSDVVYIEGYLWGSPTAGAAAVRAMEAARSAGATVAISLSDPAMAQHFLAEFHEAVQSFADIVFCNEQEAAIYAGGGTRNQALQAIGADCRRIFMTCGADGSLIWDHGEIEKVPAHKVPVVDTTGAGDIYAAGVLYGLTHGMGVAQAGKLGSFASARIVTQLGPRLAEPLAEHISAILDGAHP